MWQENLAVQKMKAETNIEAFAALAIICQKGGTAKGAQGSVYAIINGKKVELTAIRRLMREHGFNYT